MGHGSCLGDRAGTTLNGTGASLADSVVQTSPLKVNITCRTQACLAGEFAERQHLTTKVLAKHAQNDKDPANKAPYKGANYLFTWPADHGTGCT